MLQRILGFGFRLLYNELAWTYDLVAWATSMGQWRRWQRAALPELVGGRVLEIGHGTGDVLLDLIALGRHPVGLDLSPAMGRLARRKLRRHGLEAPLVRGAVQALPFPAGAFPSLLATFPTEFIFEAAVVRECYRVLQPGGRLVAVPNAIITGGAIPDRLARWLFRLTHQAATHLPDRLLDPYRAAGFRAAIKTVALPRSVVHLIVAEKPLRVGDRRFEI